jgi:hypothetical protein
VPGFRAVVCCACMRPKLVRARKWYAEATLVEEKEAGRRSLEKSEKRRTMKDKKITAAAHQHSTDLHSSAPTYASSITNHIPVSTAPSPDQGLSPIRLLPV